LRLTITSALILILSGCATVSSPQPTALIALGDNVCGREATQIYFSNQDDQLSLTAAQVLSNLGNKLARCPKRKVVLLAVSGNDGAPASSQLNANRIKIVGDILISNQLDAARIVPVTQGQLLDRAPRGPIGGVLVMTTR
jgi:hypothetical protein